MNIRTEQRIFIALFLSPALCLFSFFVAWPTLRALLYSLQKWNGFTQPEWIGLQNFATLFRDKTLFLAAFQHNLILISIAGSLILFLSLLFATLIHKRVRGSSAYKVAFFFPNVMASVAIALLWMLLYSTTDFGVINTLLKKMYFAFSSDEHFLKLISRYVGLLFLIGLFGFTIQFFRYLCTTQSKNHLRSLQLIFLVVASLFLLLDVGLSHTVLTTFLCKTRAFIFTNVVSSWSLPFPFTSSKYLIYSLIPMVVWSAVGFYMILFLAAMESIPETFYEAARLDGASEWAQFRHITFPLIREVLTVALVFLIIGSLKFFDAVWVMENQNPVKESHVMASLLYQKAFSEYNVGYGSAIAVVVIFVGAFNNLVDFAAIPQRSIGILRFA